MKKKSSFIVIFSLLVLIGISIYVYKSKSTLSTVATDARNFSFKDTAAITKIFIADKEGHASTVERTKNAWVVNGKFNCRSAAILNLMEVIKHVEVKMPVDKNGKKSVIKFMATNAVKVEIYAGSELVKQYYVGHETIDSEGSYMLLTNVDTHENYPDPFVCFIPGFKGYLKPRFIADENSWRDRIVLNYIPPQIKQIKVRHVDEPADSSFMIDVINPTTFKLKSLQNQELPFDDSKMKQYLAYFQNISYEVLITGKNKHLQDSLALQKPFCIITVATTNAESKDYKFFRKAVSADLNIEPDMRYDYDPDRLFLRFDNDKEWALSQYYVFGKLFITPKYFSPLVSVKK
jgi:hypothetical protein